MRIGTSMVIMAALVCGCAAQHPAVSGPPAPTPLAEKHLNDQLAMLRGTCEIISVERRQVADGAWGWRITYRQVEENWGTPRISVKWLELGKEGYVVGMSPVEL
jgi:hypothetical protein